MWERVLINLKMTDPRPTTEVVEDRFAVTVGGYFLNAQMELEDRFLELQGLAQLEFLEDIELGSVSRIPGDRLVVQYSAKTSPENYNNLRDCFAERGLAVNVVEPSGKGAGVKSVRVAYRGGLLQAIVVVRPNSE